MIRKTIGIIVLMYSVLFCTLETEYFGNNWTPQTKEEMICDFTSLLLCVSGIIIIYKKQNP